MFTPRQPASRGLNSHKQRLTGNFTANATSPKRLDRRFNTASLYHATDITHS